MENLRKLRKAKGLKQNELAKLVGLSESAISQGERVYTHKTIQELIATIDLLDFSV